MTRGRRPWRWLLVPLLLALLLPAALIGLLASESGTEWILRQATERVAPAGLEVHFARSSGSLLGRLELAGLAFSGNDARGRVDRLVLDWRPRALLQRQLHLRAIEVTGVRLTLPPGDGSPLEPLQIPDLQLPVPLQIDRLTLENLLIDRPDGPLLIDRLALAASIDERDLELRDLDLSGAGARLQGGLSIQASAPHTIDGRLTARFGREVTGDAIGAVTAEAALSGPALRPAVDLVLDAPAKMNLRGGLALDRPQPGFDLTVDWDEVNWPLQGKPLLTARAGHLALKGALDDYRISLDTVLHSGDLAPGELALQGRGDLHGLALQPLTLQVAGGSLRAEGALHWDDGLRWRVQWIADGLDPGVLLADWPGEINGRLDVRGRLDAAGEQVVAHARIEDVSGRLRGYPVSASGTLDWDAGRLSVDALKLASGSNQIALDGQLDEQLDLRFAIEAPELAAFYPGLRGQLRGSGQLDGTLTQPSVTAQLSGGDLGYQDLGARRLAIEVDWKPEGGKGKVRLADLDLAGVALEQVDAALDGSPADHRLLLDADGPDFGIALEARGGLQAQHWAGQLRALTLRQTAMGEWRLRTPAALQVAADEVRSGRLCLTQGSSAACATGGWSRLRGLDLSGSLRGLRLAKLAALAPGAVSVQGSLSADFSAQGPVDDPQLVFDLRPGPGRVGVADGEQRYELVFRNARINGQFANDRGSLDLELDLAENGHAEGRLTLGALRAGERALGGEVRMDFPDLALVEGFVPVLDDIEGRLDLQTSLGGTLGRPRVAGRLSVRNAGALVREAGIRVQDIALDIRGDDTGTLSVEGRASSGEGRVAIAGTVDLAATGGPTVDLSVRGEDFEAVRLPEAKVALSPDLRLQGQGSYDLSGTLRIPSAAIRIKALPRGTVEVSGDEIVVGETEAPTAVEQGLGQPSLLTARVRVELGEAVYFDGFGLTTRLVGNLDAAVDARSTTLDGRIEMRDGRYEAYGQDLEVELGRLLFAGPPGNPSVDLRAVRASFSGDVKAYLSLSGPLAKPRARVYSEPALPEAEALAYLLTGRGLDQADRQDGIDITSAALAFGLARGEPLLQQMSGRLGLDDLRIESGAGGLEGSSLVLGRYLNPNLYLGYSQGLFSPAGAVLLRVRLSERLEFESRSGVEQTFDLLYRIEHH